MEIYDDDVEFLYEYMASSLPVDTDITMEDDQSFFEGVEDEIAQLASVQVNSNLALENPSPVFDDTGFYDTISRATTENAQGQPEPCLKRTRKPSQPKAKVSKIVSAAELEAEEWVWKKNGEKQLKSVVHPRSYYRCANASVELDKCEAKRHVDQSSVDPNSYNVTYIGHHNHNPPTHKPPIRKRTKYVKIKKEEESWSN